MNAPPPPVRTAQPPLWLMVLLRWGLSILRPFLPTAWMVWLEHVALFIFMGVVNNVLAYIVYVGLLNLLDWHRQWALLGAYAAGMIIGYFNFSRYVFSGSARNPFLRFAIAYIALYLINRGLLEIVVRYGGLSDEIGQLTLLIPVAALSYVINRFLVFRGGAGQ